MNTNRSVEEDVQQFWAASQAWKGTQAATQATQAATPSMQTCGDVLDVLMPLAEQVRSRDLATQADRLAMLVIHAKRKYPKVPALNNRRISPFQKPVKVRKGTKTQARKVA